MAMAKKECPDSVKQAGADLVKLRKAAKRFADMAACTEKSILVAGEEMKDLHGMRLMELGVALKELGAMQALPGSVMVAHDSLRRMLGDCGVEEPTDDDIIVFGGGGGGGR